MCEERRAERGGREEGTCRNEGGGVGGLYGRGGGWGEALDHIFSDESFGGRGLLGI